jgi:hypothetical protein
MAVEDHVGVVEALLALPFPVRVVREGQRSSGPTYHVHVLQASEDFYDGRSEDVVTAAQAEIDTVCRTLAATLTTRWGWPELVDLESRLWAEPPPPEPIRQLCQLSAEMFVWRPQQNRRWVGLVIGQADHELPIELLAAIGDAPVS